MNKILGIVIGGVVVVALVVGGILYGPKLLKKPDTSQTVVTLLPGQGDLPVSPNTGPDLGPLPGGDAESPLAPESAPDVLIGEGEPGADVPVPADASNRALTPQETTGTGQNVAPTPRETRPTTGTGVTRPGTGTAPTGTTPTGEQPTEILPVTGPAILGAETPTPSPTGTTPSAATPTPGTTTPPEPGNYTVRTLDLVPEAKMAAVRKAMSALKVTLREQKTKVQGQAYKVAVGYFRTKAEAESWAQYYFKPRGVDYYVYAVQGMYSLQVGAYSDVQRADAAMRELYNKFPGWRLPVRRELASVSTTAYNLSLAQISKSLADRVWRELIRLGIQAEISGV
jgi:hypothetical protein